MGRDDFETVQREHFERADARHFEWQTKAPGFAPREARLLKRALTPFEFPLLEVGCGEGANLFHLLALTAEAEQGGSGRLSATDLLAGTGTNVGSQGLVPPESADTPPLLVGLDAFPARLIHARQALPAARFAGGDATALPFVEGRFRTVLIRDVLHHLPEPAAAVAEACRVLAPGGHLVLLEPNSRNPLIRLQMALVPAERGAARLDAAFLRRLVRNLPLEIEEEATLAPLPIERALLHPQLGFPRLGRLRPTNTILDGIEWASARLLPKASWSTLLLRARRL